MSSANFCKSHAHVTRPFASLGGPWRPLASLGLCTSSCVVSSYFFVSWESFTMFHVFFTCSVWLQVLDGPPGRARGPPGARCVEGLMAAWHGMAWHGMAWQSCDDIDDHAMVFETSHPADLSLQLRAHLFELHILIISYFRFVTRVVCVELLARFVDRCTSSWCSKLLGCWACWVHFIPWVAISPNLPMQNHQNPQDRSLSVIT